MSGMNAQTGRRVDAIAHLKQSLNDILSTPINSRVCRRDYGSRLPRLVDSPINRHTLVDFYAATAEAILRWEPRFALRQVQISSATQSKLELDLSGIYRPLGVPVSLQLQVAR